MPLALPAGQRAGGQFEVFEIDAHAMQLVVSFASIWSVSSRRNRPLPFSSSDLLERARVHDGGYEERNSDSVINVLRGPPAASSDRH